MLDVQGLHVYYGSRTAHGVRWVLENRKEAVAGGVDLRAAVLPQLVADEFVVLRQEASPRPVALFDRQLGRADDVGEQNGPQES